MAASHKPSAGQKSDKLWRDAIHRAVKRVEKGDKSKTKRLELLADKLVACGLAGDVSALREIGDRLDGKSVQPVSGVPDGPPITFVVEK